MKKVLICVVLAVVCESKIIGMINDQLNFGPNSVHTDATYKIKEKVNFILGGTPTLDRWKQLFFLFTGNEPPTDECNMQNDDEYLYTLLQGLPRKDVILHRLNTHWGPLILKQVDSGFPDMEDIVDARRLYDSIP
ncbi:MAG: hypothetical protein LBJ89_02105 [Holosporales bacterium]|jgi:hypothetical protein|nr:hypothetical protein [Holosporales bacterium]